VGPDVVSDEAFARRLIVSEMDGVEAEREEEESKGAVVEEGDDFCFIGTDRLDADPPLRSNPPSSSARGSSRSFLKLELFLDPALEAFSMTSCSMLWRLQSTTRPAALSPLSCCCCTSNDR
jgi:hypothetical protein